jgi:hypothetical protein
MFAMKKLFIFLFIALFAFIGNLSAQNKQQTPQIPTAQEIVLKPLVYVEDVVFIYQSFDNIEITGNEVEPFLEVKTHLQKIIKSAQTDKKQLNETMSTEIPLHIAQNMISFISRAKFTGKNAEQYKRFVDAIVESGKAIENQNKK